MNPTHRLAAFALSVAIAITTAVSVLAQPLSQQDQHLAPILIPPQRQQLIGLTFAKVAESDLVDTIHATGTVEADEELQSYVQTRFSGWIRRVYAAQTYQYVRRGEPLFTIYSPDLVSAENEYLLALRESRTLEN